MPKKLKEVLLEIELALKSNNLDKAYDLYQEINKNWKNYEACIKREELKSLLNLVDFLGELLQEKKNICLEKDKFLTMRKAYSRY